MPVPNFLRRLHRVAQDFPGTQHRLDGAMGRIELRLRRPDRAQSRLPDARLQVFRDAPARRIALAGPVETRAKVRPALRDLLRSRSPLRGSFARIAGDASA